MPCKGIRKSRQDFPADSVDGVLMVLAMKKKASWCGRGNMRTKSATGTISQPAAKPYRLPVQLSVISDAISF